MSEYTRITVSLSKLEFDALRNQAMTDYRHPRDQARYIIREGLGLAEPQNGGHGRQNEDRAEESVDL